MSNLELPRSVRVGDASNLSLHHAHTVMRDLGMNPDVTVQFVTAEACTVSGIEQLSELLRDVLPKTDTEIWVVGEGAQLSPNDVAVSIRAPYSSLITFQSVILGLLASHSGWATAANRCVTAADKCKVIVSCTDSAHPSIVSSVEYAAVQGGCIGVSTPLGGRVTSSSPHSSLSSHLVAIIGDLENALKAFDDSIPVEIPRVARVGVLNDEVEDTLLSVKSLKSLTQIYINSPARRGGTTAALVEEVYAHLQKAGRTDIDIIVGGSMDPDKIAQFVRRGAPISAFLVGSYIAGAQPIKFSAVLSKIDDNPFTQRGVLPRSGTDEQEAELTRIG